MKKNILNSSTYPLFISLIMGILLTACSHAPSHMIVAPDFITPTNKVASYLDKNAALTVQDLRANSHLVQILTKGKAADLFNGQQLLQSIIEKTLQEKFKQQGLHLSSVANNQITINIEKALINVNQSMFDYTTKTELTLAAVVNNGEKTLTKHYRFKGKSEGPLTPDLAVLGRDFNQQLAKVLTQMLNDPAIQAMIK